jgi:NADH-quinone oxidoreductase subunit E
MLTANTPQTIASDRVGDFEFSAYEREQIEHAIHHYAEPRAATIDALKIVQSQRGWVPDGAVYAIAEILSINPGDVEGVATFYNRIYRQPVGRNVIAVCDSIGCFLMGFDELYGSLQTKLGIKPGQTTADGRFTLLPIVCLGACDKAPVLMVNDATHFNVTPENVDSVLEQYK